MPTTETRRLNPLMLWGIFLAAIALVFVMIRVFARDVTEVRVAPVTRQNLVRSVSTNGKVEPIQEYQAHAPAPGVVGKVYVEVGQKVKPGELLITMNDSDATARLAAANASLSSAQAAVHDMEQGGSQDERLTLDADLSRAKLQQGQASTNLTAIEDLEKKGRHLQAKLLLRRSGCGPPTARSIAFNCAVLDATARMTRLASRLN